MTTSPPIASPRRSACRSTSIRAPRALLLTRIAEKDMNEARLRMARIPAGADLILNKVSAAPGFRIGNVHVMAGVPSIMQAMLDEVAPTLKTGVKMLSETVRAELPRRRHRRPARRDRQGASRRDDRQLSVPGRRPAQHQLVVRSRDAAQACRRQGRGRGRCWRACARSLRQTGVSTFAGTVHGGSAWRATAGPAGEGISGVLGPVPPRRAGAGLAAGGGRPVHGDRCDHPRRARAGGDRRARARTCG